MRWLRTLAPFSASSFAIYISSASINIFTIFFARDFTPGEITGTIKIFLATTIFFAINILCTEWHWFRALPLRSNIATSLTTAWCFAAMVTCTLRRIVFLAITIFFAINILCTEWHWFRALPLRSNIATSLITAWCFAAMVTCTLRRPCGGGHDASIWHHHDRATHQNDEQHHARRDNRHPPLRHRCRRRWQEGGTERNSSGVVIISKSIGDGMVSAGLRLLLEKIHGYSY